MDKDVDDMTAQEEEAIYKKSLAAWQDSDEPPRLEFQLNVLVEGAIHLPILDHPWQDIHMPVIDASLPRSTSVRPETFLMCTAVYRSSAYFDLFPSQLTLGSHPHVPERD